MRGRKTNLTEAIIKKICKCIANGNYRCVAAKAAGISESAFVKWMATGRRATSGIHREFVLAVLKAEQEAEIAMVERVVSGALTDPKHAQWWLERKVPKRWSRDRLQIKVLEKRVAELEKAANGIAGASHSQTGSPEATSSE